MEDVSLLMRCAEDMCKVARKQWRDTGKVLPLAVTWPKEPLVREDGVRAMGPVIADLPVDLVERQAFLSAMVQMTKARALVLVEAREQAIVVLFECPSRTRMWKLPLERHGDVVVPGTVEVRDNEESLGLLWSSTPSSTGG